MKQETPAERARQMSSDDVSIECLPACDRRVSELDMLTLAIGDGPACGFI